MRLVFASAAVREALQDAEGLKRLGERIAGQDRTIGWAINNASAVRAAEILLTHRVIGKFAD